MRAVFRTLIWMMLVTAPMGLTMPASAGSTSAARIAVVSDASEKDLASLVTTELSSGPSVTLIERDDLAKIGDEIKVQQMAGSDTVALGRLAGADGLVFLDKGPDGALVRFTAVNLGYALFDDPIPIGIDAAQQAKAIAHLVVADAAKLKLDPSRAIPISVLNLRANTASTNSATLERALTALLESRLASVPEYVVLERRHADTLGFERTLATPDPLLKGAYLIDGSIALPVSDAGGLHVSLRLRSPKTGEESALDFKGTTADLPGLVETMGKSIELAIGSATSPPQWQPAAEAREYLEEGIWGWQHHDPRAALETLDSAALLGETASDLLAIRVQVLCLLAGQQPYFYGGKELAPEPIPLDERVGLIRRAMDDLRAYQHDGEKKLQIFNTNRNIEVRTGDLHGEVLKEGLVILRLLDPASPMTNDLRQELRDLAGFDPAHGKFPEFYGTEPNDLSNSLDEELAYYRVRATTQIHWLPSVNADHFCERFLKTPEEQNAGYDRFAQGLLADPKGRLFGLLLQARGPDAETRDAAYAQFLNELWTRRDELAKDGVLQAYLSQAANLPEDLRRKHMKQAMPMLLFGLAQNDMEATQIFRFLWLPSAFPPEEAPAIWREFQDWKGRRMTKLKGLQEQGIDVQASLYEQQFLALFPQSTGDAGEKERPRLTVDKFWSPGAKFANGQDYNIFQVSSTQDCIWVLADAKTPSGAGLFKVRLSDWHSDLLDTECGNRPYDAASTSHGIFVTYGKYPDGGGPIQTFLKRYDASTQTWTTRRISDITAGSFYGVDDQLYFDLWTVVGQTQEGGLARYDWDADKLTILASSRRKPALNQFDDRSGYQIHGLFLGPGNRLCVNADGGVYYVHDQSGQWEPVFDFAQFVGVQTQGRQTLVISQNGEIVLLDADKPDIAPLMKPSEPEDWRKDPGSPKLVKRAADWASRAPWTAEPQWKPLFRELPYTGYHGGHLFLLQSPDNQRKYFQLLWFTPGNAQPRTIPLRFLANASEDEAMKTNWPTFPGDWRLFMLTTEKGICFHNLHAVWYLPFGDVQAFLKKHDEDRPESVTVKAAAKVPPAKSFSGDDDYDPGDPTSFR
jgi:hypothetical protein